MAKPNFPKPRLQALFIACNDLEAIENFYGEEILELPVCGGAGQTMDVWIGMYLTFYKHEDAKPLYNGWAEMSGVKSYRDNQHAGIAWSIELERSHFDRVVEKIKQSSVLRPQELPEYRNYREGFTVQDPMGYTIEVCVVEDRKK